MNLFNVDIAGKTIAEVTTNEDRRGLCTDALIAFTDGTVMQIGATDAGYLVSSACVADDRPKPSKA